MGMYGCVVIDDFMANVVSKSTEIILLLSPSTGVCFVHSQIKVFQLYQATPHPLNHSLPYPHTPPTHKCPPQLPERVAAGAGISRALQRRYRPHRARADLNEVARPIQSWVHGGEWVSEWVSECAGEWGNRVSGALNPFHLVPYLPFGRGVGWVG